MAQIVKIKNATLSDGTWAGQFIPTGTYYQIQSGECEVWKTDQQVFADIAAGNLVVNNGVEDITDPTRAWSWLEGDTMPYSRHLEGKLAVHSSSKPEPAGITTYAVWAGSGDNVNEADEHLSLGAGELLTFNMNYDAGGAHVVSKDVKFDPRHGRVWIHEAYLKFENGGVPDFLNADIMAPATALQQAVNLDLVVDGSGWVTLAPGGPGTGTHGFAATPTLIPRSYSKDGDWDFDGANLTPNMSGTGGYKIRNVDTVVHRYFNKIPLHGSSTTYFTMSSDETAELPVALGYFLRINVHNNSNSAWKLSIIMEIFRERTSAP